LLYHCLPMPFEIHNNPSSPKKRGCIEATEEPKGMH